MPVISRLVLNGEEDRQILRALGAAPGVVAADSFIGVMVAIVAGTVLACGLSVALASLAPLGPVRRVYHPSALDG